MAETTASPKPRQILSVLFLGVLMAALDIAIVGPALPALREHFGVDERDVAWVFSLFVLCNLAGLPLMAKAADAYGRRTVYLVDVALFALGSLAVALAPSFPLLLAGRGLQGLGASGIFPVASAVVGDVFPPQQRGRALGLIGAVFGLAFIVGPILGGILLQFGWPWLFFVNLPLAATVFIAGRRVLPEAKPERPQPLDWRGIGTLVLSLAALTYGINRIDTSAVLASMSSAAVWPLFAAAAGGLALFVYVERRATAPLLRLALFERRQVWLVSILSIGAGLTEAAFVFFSAFAVASYGVSKSTASFMLLPLVFAVALGSPLGGRLLDRVGSRVIIVFGTSLLTAGMAIMGLLAGERFFFYTGSVLIGLGLSCLLGSSLSYILLNEAKVSERTVVQGIGTVFISIGQLTGAAFIGAVAASGGAGASGFMKAFLLIAVLTLLLTIASLALKGRAAELASAKTASGPSHPA